MIRAVFDTIFSIVWDIAFWFHDLRYLMQDVPLIGGWLDAYVSPILQDIFSAIYDMVQYIAQIGDWAADMEDSIVNFLTEAEIWSAFSYWFIRADLAWQWIQDAFDYVNNLINEWWSSTTGIVQGWIDDVRLYAEGLVDNVTGLLSSLQAAWDAFKGKIPTINEIIAWFSNWSGELLTIINEWWSGALLQVQGLIDSAFIIRESLWAGWQDWRDQVAEFFSDPVEFVWTKFTDWFLGPEG